MTFRWYRIFNLQEFLDTELPCRTLQIQLVGRGLETFLISRGNVVSISYGDIYLPIDFLGMDRFIQDGHASYLDSDGWVWFGFEIPE